MYFIGPMISEVKHVPLKQVSSTEIKVEVGSMVSNIFLNSSYVM